MIQWLDTGLVTLFDTVTIPWSWPVIALASILLAWSAHQKQRSELLWFLVGLGGFIAASEVVRALIPAAVLELKRGEVPGVAYTLWSDAAFRADLGLLLIIIVLLIGLNAVVRRLMTCAAGRVPCSLSQMRVSAAGSAALLAVPVVFWAWAAFWFAFVSDYTDLILPLIIFLLLVLVAGTIRLQLHDPHRRWGTLGLIVLVILAQLRYNATRPPGSIFESNGSVPFFLALIPVLIGIFAAQIIQRTLPRRHYALMAWQIGLLLWGTVMVGWAVKFMGFYDYQDSYAFALGSLFETPIRALKALDKLYYDAVPREIATDRNAANMNDWETVLVVLAGFGVWLSTLAQIGWRLPALNTRRSLIHGLQQFSISRLSLREKRYLLAFVLITPALALRIFTTFYPFVQTLILSIQKYNPAFPPRQYVDLRNFEKISTDLVVRESLEFTLIFVFVSTFFQMFLGLAIAHLLNANFRLRSLARTISLIPWAVPMVVAAIGFRWMFDDQFGMIPDLLRRGLGIHEKWLVDPTNAQIAVISVNVWKSTPFCALLLLAGLQGISLDLYEAAKVDGANWLASLRFITVPMLLPIIVTVTMFMLVWQLAVFDLPFAMTGGAPGFATTVVAQKIYLEINSLNYSSAAAISVMLVVFVTLIGGLGVYALRRVEVSG